MLSYEIKNVSFAYHSSTRLLDNISFNLNSNSTFLLQGENGSGKSTLLKLMAGLISPTKGQVLLNNQSISQIVPAVRTKYVAYLPQNVRHFFTFSTGKQQFEFVFANLGLSPTDIHKVYHQTVTRFKLTNIITTPIQLLSGGELQRMALALILSIDAEYLFLDEPFANLDTQNRQFFIEQLLQLKQHKTIFFIEHNLTGLNSLVDNVFYLNQNGKIIHNETTSLSQVKTKVSRVTASLSGDNLPTKFQMHALTLKFTNKLLVNNQSFAFPAGKMGLICGKNGIGKTTLFNSFTKQQSYCGEVFFNHLEEKSLSTKKWFCYVNLGFQNAEDQFIKTTVKAELNSAQKVSHHPEFWANQVIHHWCDKLNLLSVLNESPYYISGGQQKKVQLLILAIISAPVILLDETFTGLDQASLTSSFELIETLKKFNITILVIDHDLTQLNHFDYVLQLQNQALTLLKKGTNVHDY